MSVITPRFVPLTTTFTPGSGSPEVSVTTPVIGIWAIAGRLIHANKNPATNIRRERLVACPRRSSLLIGLQRFPIFSVFIIIIILI
jgi:hypothetical protein